MLLPNTHSALQHGIHIVQDSRYARINNETNDLTQCFGSSYEDPFRSDRDCLARDILQMLRQAQNLVCTSIGAL